MEYKIVMMIIRIVGLVMIMLGQGYSEMALQPLQISGLFMMAGFIFLVYLPKITTARSASNIAWISD